MRYAVTDGDVDALYDGIVDGSAEFGEVTKSQAVNWPLEDSGTYYFVAVGFAGGEAVSDAVTTIRFKSSHEFAPKFDPVGTGTFTYSLYFEGDDPGLTISKSSADNTYRISHWGYDVNFDFTWDPATNKCQVSEQFTGDVHDTYGDVFVSDVPSYDDEATYDEYPCYYDPATKTFTFNLVYYVSAGYFDLGPETFTVEWNEDAAAPAKVVRKQLSTLKNLTPRKMGSNKGKVNFTREKKQF